MQLTLNVRNALVGAALIAGGYYGYRGFFGDIQTEDIPTLIRVHRTSSALKRHSIRGRVLRLYKAPSDYATVVAALGHRSATTRAFAVEILAATGERRAVRKLVEMLRNRAADPRVKEQLAHAFALLPSKAAVPRLIELTAATEEQDVRIAAHNALREMLGTGAQVKFGDGVRTRWTLWWRDHRGSVRIS